MPAGWSGAAADDEGVGSSAAAGLHCCERWELEVDCIIPPDRGRVELVEPAMAAARARRESYGRIEISTNPSHGDCIVHPPCVADHPVCLKWLPPSFT